MLLGLKSTSNIIIALSGASHSGKTTFLTEAETVLGKDNVICISENIREIESVKSVGIENIRKDPLLYFEVQKEIITKKIKQEIEAGVQQENKIILIDRSLADSIWYFTKYVEISNFSDDKKAEYFDFLSKLGSAAERSFALTYDAVFIFPPIKKEEQSNDAFRQDLTYFDKSQEAEFIQIATLNEGIAKIVEVSHKIVPVDTLFQKEDKKYKQDLDTWQKICYRLRKR